MTKKISVILLLVTTLFSCSSKREFDLTTWKITLPIAKEDGSSAKEIKTPELVAGYTSEYFYYNDEGAMVFYCPVGMSSTINSNYSRSELRELIDGEHSDVNWTLHGTHILNTTERVTEVPSNGRTVTSQIHGIYPDGTNGPVLVKVEYNGVEESVVVLLKTATYKNAADERHYLRGIKLGDEYSTTIKVVEGRVFVTVTSGKKVLEASKNFYQDDPTWENYRFYYKVGNYAQDSVKDYEGEAATVIVYELETSHSEEIENIEPKEISLSKSLDMENGNDVLLEPVFAPFDTTNVGCTWEIVEGDDVITLSSKGEVTAKKTGNAIVKVKSVADDSLFATCDINVMPATEKTAEVIYENDFGKPLGDEWELKNSENGTLEIKDGELVWIDTEKTISRKASLNLGDLVGTSTIEFDVNLTRLDIKDRGNSKEQSSYYYVDVNSATNENLMRIRSKADLVNDNLLDPRIVLSRGYLEPKINKTAAKTPLGTTHTVTMVVRTDDNSARANTSDIYIDGKKVGEKIKNNSKQSAVSRIEFFSGTKDMLDFTIDNLKVYEGEKLPEGAEPAEVTVDPFTAYLGVGGSSRIAVDGNTTFKVVKGSEFASVSDSGLVTGIKPGTATIMVGESEELSVEILDEIVKPFVITLTKDFTILPVEGTLDLKKVARVAPYHAKERRFKITVTEGKDSISIEDGVVTALSPGKVNLMITALGNQEIIEFIDISVVNPGNSPEDIKTFTFDEAKAGTQVDKISESWSVQKVDGVNLIANVDSTMANSGKNSLFLLDNSSSNKPYALAKFAFGAASKGSISFDAFIPSNNEKTIYVNIGTGKNNADRYFELRLQPSGTLQYENGKKDVEIASYSKDEWHTYTAEWSDGNFTIYVDGVLTDAKDIAVKSTGLSVTNIPTTITFYAGDTKSTGTKCYIDNVSSYLF